MEILKQGVEAWNQWRRENPDVTPDLRKADLSGADFQGVNLHGAHLANAKFVGADLTRADFSDAGLVDVSFEGASLREANLRGAKVEKVNLDRANLQGATLNRAVFDRVSVLEASFQDAAVRDTDLVGKVTGLRSEQLSGTDLSSTKLPEEIARFDGLRNVEETSRNARKLFHIMLLVCAYSALTLATTTDAGLLTNSASSPLPIIGSSVRILDFYWVIPALLVGVYVYFHLYLQSLWEALASLPAIFPDGRTLDRAAYPWLLNVLVSAHFEQLKDQRPQLFRLKLWASSSLAWCVVPLILLGFWFRFLTRQEIAGTTWHTLWIAGSVVLGLIFHRLASRTLLREQTNSRGGSQFWDRYRMFLNVLVGLCSVSLFWLLSFGVMGMFPSFVASANFEHADVSSKPLYWTGDNFLELVSGARLEQRNLRSVKAEGAFLARANLTKTVLSFGNLRGADLRESKLHDANLSFADMRGANLGGAKGLTQEQINQARGDEDTQLPEELRAPLHWLDEEYALTSPESFRMGCVEGDDGCDPDERPPRSVAINNRFLIRRTEVTVKDYKYFLEEKDFDLPRSLLALNPTWEDADQQDHPVVGVSWDEAVSYCEWVGGRLPTEAEWEYAARGGEKGLRYPNGNQLTQEDANFRGTGGADQWELTAPVGKFPPNGYGLYDMAGNSWEWVADWYEKDAYHKTPPSTVNPIGPSSGTLRVVRGGSWNDIARKLRLSYRSSFEPGLRGSNVGFRCAREVFP